MPVLRYCCTRNPLGKKSWVFVKLYLGLTAAMVVLLSGCGSTGTKVSPLPSEPVIEEPTDTTTTEATAPIQEESTEPPAPQELTQVPVEEPGIKELSQEEQQNVQRLMLRAQLLYDGGDLDGAIQLYAEAAQIAPASARVLLRLGQAYLDKSDHQTALEIAQQAAKHNPEDADIQGLMAECWVNLGQLEAAYAAALEEIKLNPNSIQGHEHVSELGAQLGETDRVIESLQKLTYLDSRNSTRYRYKLAETLVAAGRMEEAVEAYQKVAAEIPQLVEVWQQLAALLTQMGRQEEAIECYRKALAQPIPAENAIRLRYSLAEALLRQRLYAEAYTEYQKIREAEPNQLGAWHKQIEILISQKQYERALDEIAKYLAAVPTNVVSIALLEPQCRLALGKKEEAIRCLLGIFDLVKDDSRTKAADYAMIGETCLDEQIRNAALETGLDGSLGERLLQAQVRDSETLLIPAALLMLERKLGRTAAGEAISKELFKRLIQPPDSSATQERRILRAQESLAVLGQMVKNPDLLAEGLLYDPGDSVSLEVKQFWLDRFAQLLNDASVAEPIAAMPQVETIRKRLQELVKNKPEKLPVRLGLIQITPEAEREEAHRQLLEWLNEVIRNGNEALTEQTVATLLSGSLFDRYSKGTLSETFVQTLAQAQVQFPENIFFGYAHGIILAARDRNEEAETQFKAIIEKQPGNDGVILLAKKRLAWLYDRLQRDNEALQLLEEMNQALPDDLEILRHLTMIYDQLDDVEKMEAVAQRVIELTPNDPESFNMLGYMYAVRNIKLDRALELVEKALELDPKNGNITDSLGWIYYRLGHYDRAVETLERAAQLMKEEHPVVLDHLGDAYEKIGKVNEAVQFWQRALVAGPEFPYEFTDQFKTSVQEKIRRAGGQVP